MVHLLEMRRDEHGDSGGVGRPSRPGVISDQWPVISWVQLRSGLITYHWSLITFLIGNLVGLGRPLGEEIGGALGGELVHWE
jgi:hypothetical protein